MNHDIDTIEFPFEDGYLGLLGTNKIRNAYVAMQNKLDKDYIGPMFKKKKKRKKSPSVSGVSDRVGEPD